MANIFISHSSHDKAFAKNIANDLKTKGHNPWLDEWEINVGDCIISKIDSGLETCEYVVILLSTKSIRSNWVDKEWKTKCWDEINSKSIKLLSALIDDCTIPYIMKTKNMLILGMDHWCS